MGRWAMASLYRNGGCKQGKFLWTFLRILGDISYVWPISIFCSEEHGGVIEVTITHIRGGVGGRRPCSSRYGVYRIQAAVACMSKT